MRGRGASSSARRCAVRQALTLLVACAAALVAGATSAVPARAAAPPQLTAAASPEAVVYPGSAVIAGALTGESAGVGGAVLELLHRPAGTTAEWAPAGSTTTLADGTFSFKVAPAVSTDYQVRYPGGADVPVLPADVTLPVRPRLTFSAPESLWLGGTILLRGTVTPAHPGATVAIDRKVAGVWQPFLSATLDETSRLALRWSPAEFGYYRLRVRLDADADHAAGVSASRLVIVNRPNAHRVPMKYAHYIVIVRHEYRLYYYEHGVMVRRFDVALGKPGYATPLGYYRIYGKRKPAGGALGSCAMFYRRAGGIAIHGTNQPYLIRRPAPRAYSHGCARMLNRQALWLYARAPVGTRVHNLR